jgi:hypothetical protein
MLQCSHRVRSEAGGTVNTPASWQTPNLLEPAMNHLIHQLPSNQVPNMSDEELAIARSEVEADLAEDEAFTQHARACYHDLLAACESMLRTCGSPQYWKGETRESLLLIEAAVAKSTGMPASNQPM